MPDEQLQKKVFYGELQEGKRSQGGQKKRYKDTIKASLKDFDIPVELHRRDQSGGVSSTKEQLSLKKRERKERKAQRTQNQDHWAASGFLVIALN